MPAAAAARAVAELQHRVSQPLKGHGRNKDGETYGLPENRSATVAIADSAQDPVTERDGLVSCSIFQ